MYETTRLAIALRMARAAGQWTQQEMAEKLDLTKAIVARNERPDMAMRADTLVKLIHFMKSEMIEVDLFSTADRVVFYAEGADLDAMAMRVSRAALNLSQQAFADKIGLTKPLVTRGERPDQTMTSKTLIKMMEGLCETGITVDFTPIVSELRVTVERDAVESLEAQL